MSIFSDLLNIFSAQDQLLDDRHKAVMNALTTQRMLIMALATEVQALHDAVAAQNVQITAAVAELLSLENSVADLSAKLAALSTGTPIGAEDLAEINASTAAINASITNIKAAMPQPVPEPVVTAAADASATP